MDSGIAFQLGPVAVRWYSLCIAAGVLAGYFVAYYRAKARGQDPENVSNILIISFIVAIISSRLYYVVFNFNFYRSQLTEVFAVWHGGLAIHGGIIGALATLVIYT